MDAARFFMAKGKKTKTHTQNAHCHIYGERVLRTNDYLGQISPLHFLSVNASYTKSPLIFSAKTRWRVEKMSRRKNISI